MVTNMKNKDTFSTKKTLLIASALILGCSLLAMLGYTVMGIIYSFEYGFNLRIFINALAPIGPMSFISYIVVWGIPAGLTLFNIFSLITYNRINNFTFKVIEFLSIALGGLYTFLYLCGLKNVEFTATFDAQLYDAQMHPPISADQHIAFFITLGVVFIGYVLLIAFDAAACPPLVTVISLSAMYFGAVMCIIFTVQVIKEAWLAAVFPINFVIIVIKMALIKVQEYKKREVFLYKNRFIAFLDRTLRESMGLPLLAVIFLAPLLGIIVLILTLFNQQPDSLILLFTETSEWQLSTGTAPPNIVNPSGHYLCTVAANGHKNVVKPLRYGKRHSGRIVVNRQLLVANAFEQILEEKIPRVHKVIRNFYDKHGFPLSKYITTKLAADIVYIIMKPLEWFFVAFIYLFDSDPESRIAKQYLGTNDFTKSK